MVVSGFGRSLLRPKWKLHFLLNPLLSFVVSSSFSLRPLKEWVGGPARSDVWAQCERGLRLRRFQGSHALRSFVSRAGGSGRIASKPSHWPGPHSVRAHLSALHSATRRSLCTRQFWGHTLPHCSLSGNRGDWCESPRSCLPCPALPTPLPWRHGVGEGLGSQNSFETNENNNNYNHVA